MIINMPNIPSELFYKFNGVKFNDDIHKYYVNGRELVSVTTVIEKFVVDFDEDYWSVYKSEEYSISPKKVLFGWNFINKKATTKGSIVHNYAENLFNNKYFPYPKDMVMKSFGFDPIYNDFLKEKALVDKFYNDCFNKLIPIKTELVIYDAELGIGGMIDLLVYNVTTGEFQLWDYKTNKELSMSKDKKLLGCLSDLDDCHHEKYSLQLSSYKYILEKNIKIKLGKSYLVWINEKNDNYKIIEAKDRTQHASKMINMHNLGLVV
jgi:hypothetical protein